jgi:hypothetical protein
VGERDRRNSCALRPIRKGGGDLASVGELLNGEGLGPEGVLGVAGLDDAILGCEPGEALGHERK